MFYPFSSDPLCSFVKTFRIGILAGLLVFILGVNSGSRVLAVPFPAQFADGGFTPFAALPIYPDPGPQSLYQYRDRPSPDGIGKVYMGREIAQVMGYQGAAWLERPSRTQSEKPHLLVANLDIRPTDTIADIGAGTGFLTVRLARQVPEGRVLAIDVQPEMISILRQRIDDQKLNNVEPVLAIAGDPNLPENSVDMAIMLDVYHELEYPYETMQAVVKSLRPGGQVVLVEYRGENPFIPIKRLHKMTEKQVRRELAAVGLTWMYTNEDLPQQHLVVFEKRKTTNIPHPDS